MFCNGLKESHEERVHIKGLDSRTMQTLLQYTYTSRAHFTCSNVQRILEAASQFQVKRCNKESSGTNLVRFEHKISSRHKQITSELQTLPTRQRFIGICIMYSFKELSK